MRRQDVAGTVYLLHFDRPLKHAKHYLGWAYDVNNRLEVHRSGQGSRLMAAVKREGIPWTLAKTWPGTRNDERRMKRQKNIGRQCPKCKEAMNAMPMNKSKAMTSSQKRASYDMPEPGPRQVWEDKSQPGREIKVESVEGTTVHCKSNGRRTQIKLSRFVPTRGGYTYLRTDAE